MMRLALAASIAASAIACASGGTQDIVPESTDSRGATQAAASGGSYAHVAKRAMGFVALARADGVDPEDAARAVDRLADSMDACAANLAANGKLVDGAIRLTARVKPDGTLATERVTVAPGDAVAANALLCVVAPLKLLTLVAIADAGVPAIAIDASWGPVAKNATRPTPPAP